jgi:hypothetical protein
MKRYFLIFLFTGSLLADANKNFNDLLINLGITNPVEADYQPGVIQVKRPDGFYPYGTNGAAYYRYNGKYYPIR